MLQKGHLLLLAIGLLSTPALRAQGRLDCEHGIQGFVHSASDHKPLPYCSIRVPELRTQLLSDSLGFFRICAVPATYERIRLVLKTLGYDSLDVQVKPGGKVLHLHLRENSQWLHQVDVKGEHRHFESEVSESQALHKTDLERARGESLGKVLSRLPGVFSVQTGPGIAKPMLQGMTGMRVAIVQQGVKLEGQQWGFDHAPETDPGLADEIVVVKGAQTLRYGPEAIGGLILLDAGDLAPAGKLQGKWGAGYHTNGRGFHQLLSLENGFGKEHSFQWRLRGNVRKSGAYSSPAYVLGNTGNEELSLQGILRHSFGTRWKNELQFSEYHTRIGIFPGSHISSAEGVRAAFQRPDSSYRYAFSYHINRPNQLVGHRILKIKSQYQLSEKEEIQASLAYQYDARKEFDLVRLSGSNCPDCPQLSFFLQSWTPELLYVHKKDGREIKAGLTGQYLANITRRHILIPNFRQQQVGAFVIGQWFRDRWAYEAGIRADYRHLQIFRYVGNQLEEPVHHFSQFMANAGLRYLFNDHWHVKANLVASQRPPHVAELYANGVHQGSPGFEKGNPGMRPETIFNANLGIHHESEHVEMVAQGFATYSPNYLYLSPVGDSIITTIRGAFPLFEYRQSEVRLMGGDFSLTAKVGKNLSLLASGSMIRAWNFTDRNYLVYQPADRIRLQGRWQQELSDIQISFLAGPQFVSKQFRAPQNIDFLPPPSGYVLWSAGLGLHREKKPFPFDLSLELENAFNTRYRDYLNRFRYFAWDLGRNVHFRLTIPFSS